MESIRFLISSLLGSVKFYMTSIEHADYYIDGNVILLRMNSEVPESVVC